jgi:hypothetical protein
MGMPNNNEVAAGFRFALPATGWLVDKTLTDVALRLTFTGANNGSYTAKMYLESGATPGVLTTASGNISGRTKSTAFLYFGSGVVKTPNADEVKSYSSETTNSLLTMVSEIITAHTAAAIDALVFIVSYQASTTNGYRDIFAYDKLLVPATDSDPGPPRLVLTYDETISLDDRTTVFLMEDVSKVEV